MSTRVATTQRRKKRIKRTAAVNGDFPGEKGDSLAPRPSLEDLYAAGRALRDKCPRTSQATWKPVGNRPDPVHWIEESDRGRIPELVPIRHGRMLVSPFTFYRGSALNMAADLAETPATGARVQACGDAHLSNFGGFATPERRVIFAINDLDETHPAPWEWDVKRLATSFVLACRDNALGKGSARDAVLTCVESYRERMGEYAEMPVLEVWYDSEAIENLVKRIGDLDIRERAAKVVAKAKARRVAEHDFPKLAEVTRDGARIRDCVPTIYHWPGAGLRDWDTHVQAAFANYRKTLAPAVRLVLDRFEFKDIALKVVGVGSVGMACFVILLMAGDADPLFLQVKEARASVLEAFAGKSTFAHHGERVVTGQRIMQAASDMFLGWTQGPEGRQFYVRQLRDVKIKAVVEQFGSGEMQMFARWCGAALAHSHARSVEPAVISGYLGKSDRFDRAIAEFAVAYADQVESDYEAVRKAATGGRLKIEMERD